MRSKRLPWLAAILLPAALRAGVDPRPAAADYAASDATAICTVGAEFLARTIPGKDESFHSGRYVVVELGVFAHKPKMPTVAAGDFRLRINRARVPLMPQTGELVAAGLKYPTWEPGPNTEVAVGAGDKAIVLGRPDRVQRFPGDPNGVPNGLPRPQAPEQDPTGGQAARPHETAPDAAIKAAWDDGPVGNTRGGLLYFLFEENTRKIRTLELEVSGACGPLKLKLL